jgi:hypothetical protein
VDSAQGFNPDHYTQFCRREPVAQRHYRLSGKASLAGANKIQAGICYFTPSRGCRGFAEIAPGCFREIARHSGKQCSIGFQPVLFAPSTDSFQVSSVLRIVYRDQWFQPRKRITRGGANINVLCANGLSQSLALVLVHIIFPPKIEVLSQSFSSSSSSFVLGRFSGGTSETPVACFLHSSFFHPANCLDPPARTKNDDEDEDDTAGR